MSLQSKSPLLHAMQSTMRLRHFSPRTETVYLAWVRRYIRFHRLRHPGEMGAAEVRAFLEHLAGPRRLSASSINQALAALLLLYADVLRQPLEALGPMPRAKQPERLPVVLTRDEVRRVLQELDGVARVIGVVLYGSGMRLTECLSVRVKDVDLERGEFRIRRGKGAKDRVTVLPQAVRGALVAQLEEEATQQEADTALARAEPAQAAASASEPERAPPALLASQDARLR